MKYNSQSITIRVDAGYNKENTKIKAQALAILVGGEYNRYGRHIDLEKFEALYEKYELILQDMKDLI